MHRLVASLALGATLVVAALTISRPALACSCMRPEDALAALEGATAVFEGKMVERNVVPGKDLPQLVKFTFEVTRHWKGAMAPGDTVEITTADNSAACGRDFDAGQLYMVYASGAEGDLQDNLCSRTMSADEAEMQGDFEDLGPSLDLDGGDPIPLADPEPAPVEPSEGTSNPPVTPRPTEADGRAKQGCAVETVPNGHGLAVLGLLGLLGAGSLRRRGARRS